MQKFTRSLRREIEIEGNRLAVTLDEKGISIRPVGSRKAPKEATWLAILCAVTGQKEIKDVLAALDGGGTASTAASDGELAELLKRLDAWLAKNRPNYHEGLLPGATTEELNKLEKAIGRSLPADLRT